MKIDICKNCGGAMPDKGKSWPTMKVTRYPMMYIGDGIAEEMIPLQNGPNGGSNFQGMTPPTKGIYSEFVFCCKAPKR